MTSLKGTFLVAARAMNDPNFTRSVTLMLEHDATNGAMGVVVNQPTGIDLRSVWPQVSDAPCTSDAEVFRGGPCEGPLFALHGEAMYGDEPLLPGLFVVAAPEMLESLVASDVAPLRFVAGYAGWSPGQLEAEYAEGAWRSLPASVARVLGPHDELWATLMREHTARHVLGGVNPRAIPDDPSLN